MAIWEITRGLRWVNLLLGAWLVAAPFVFGYDLVPLVNTAVAGALLALFAFAGGNVTGRYAGGWSELFRRGA